MMFNNRPRGIALNKNATNIQQPIGAENEQHNENLLIDINKPPILQQQPLNPIKRLTQLDFTKFNNIISDENAIQPTIKQQDPENQQPPKNNLLETLKSTFTTAEPIPPTTRSQALQPISNIVTRQQAENAGLKQQQLLKQIDSKKDEIDELKQKQQEKPKQLLINLPSKIAKPKSLIPLPTDKLTEIEDIDKSESRDAMYLVSDIAKDIYEYMFVLEVDQSIREDYLKDQKIFTPKVRHRLVNWCIEIHQTLKLLPETLYMTISVIDRYFNLVQVKQQSLVQLVAVGATLIASKYEEIYPPDLGDLIHLTQNSYSRSDIFKIEINILQTLNFNLGKPIPLAFLRRFSKANHSDLKLHSIAKYLMELSLTEYECCHWRPSLLAAAALFTSIHLVHQDTTPPGTLTRRFGTTRGMSLIQPTSSLLTTSSLQSDRWNRTLVHYTHYTRKQLQEPAVILCKILKKSQKSPLSYYVVKKNQASLVKWPELKSTRVDQLIKLGDQSQ